MEPLFQCGNGIYLFCGPECVAVLVNFIHDTFPCLDLCGFQGAPPPAFGLHSLSLWSEWERLT